MHSMSFIRRSVYAVAVIVLVAAPALRAEPYEETIKKSFFMPDVIRQTHELIGLTDDQQTTLLAAVQEVQDRMQGFKENIDKEKAALLEMVKADRLDEQKVTAQAQKVMDLENKVKLTQLSLLIKIKNTLTPAQQAKLRESSAKYSEIQTKLARAMALATRVKDSGGDVSALQQSKEQFDDLVQQGKLDEANALLDKTLKTLEEKAGAGK